MPYTELPAQVNGDIEDYYEAFSEIEAPSGFLLNLGFTVQESIENFILPDVNSTLEDRLIIANNYYWQDLYQKLYDSDQLSPKTLDPVENIMSYGSFSNSEVAIGVLYMDGDYIHSDTTEAYFDDDTEKILPDAPMEPVNIFAISTLKDAAILNGSGCVEFIIDPNLLFTNRTDDLLGFEIDFDDDNGLVFFPFTEQTISVCYQNTGVKNIQFNLITSEYSLTSYGSILVYNTFAASQRDTLVTTLPNGETTSGLVKVYLGCDSIFDKPFILVEGFEPFPNNDTTRMYRKWLYAWENLIKDRGYDLVTVKFLNNHDYIQHNAQVVREMLHYVNQTKVGHYENVITGESMGGLTTRIALAEMEEAGETHNVRLYISFDSPHGGANMPLSIQEFVDDALNNYIVDIIGGIAYFLDFLSFITPGVPSSDFGDGLYDAISDVEQVYNAPASRQMLIRHREHKHVINPDHLDFRALLNGVGYPEHSRNVTVINGSNVAAPQLNGSIPLDFEDRYLEFGAGSGWAGIDAWAKVSPINMDTVKFSQIKIKLLFLNILNKTGYGTFFDKAYDLAPGGKFFFGGSPDFSFVPVASSIDLDTSILNSPGGLYYFDESSGDPARSKHGIVQAGLTPFDDIYSSEENSGHVDLGAANGDLLSNVFLKEYMMDIFALENRTFQDGQQNDFYAHAKLMMGEGVTPWPEKEIESGPVLIKPGAIVEATSAGTVELHPGFRVESGAVFEGRIVQHCTPTFNRSSTNVLDSIFSSRYIPDPVIVIQEMDNSRNEFEFSLGNDFPEAVLKQCHWKLHGAGITMTSTDPDFRVSDLPSAQYSISCSLAEGRRHSSKLFIVWPDKADEDSEFRSISPKEEKAALFNIYPNPGLDLIKVAYFGTGEFLAVEIFDLSGRRWVQKTFFNDPSAGEGIPVNVSSLANGIYLIRISDGTNKSTQKLSIVGK